MITENCCTHFKEVTMAVNSMDYSGSDFVLTTFQRFPGGETSGDAKVIDQVRRLFFRI
jgi:hypothetical protein